MTLHTFDYDINIFFFFKQKTAYEMSASLVGSEMCIRDRTTRVSEDSCNTLVYIINKSKKKQKAARKLHS